MLQSGQYSEAERGCREPAPLFFEAPSEGILAEVKKVLPPLLHLMSSVTIQILGGKVIFPGNHVPYPLGPSHS
jgi:hypothetical protein